MGLPDWVLRSYVGWSMALKNNSLESGNPQGSLPWFSLIPHQREHIREKAALQEVREEQRLKKIVGKLSFKEG